MVGRRYAGMLGLIAFIATMFRALVHAASLEAAVVTSIGCMCVFAVLGYLAGWAGATVVGDAVRVRFHAELNRTD